MARPPIIKRVLDLGAASHRPGGYGRHAPEYWKRANEEILSAALGHVGNPAHPDVQAAMARVETAARSGGVALGNVTRNWDQARELYRMGYQFLTLGSDASLLTPGAQDILGWFRQELAGSP